MCDRANAELTPFERRTLVGADPCKTSKVIVGEDTYVMDRPELGTITTWRDLSIDTSPEGFGLARMGLPGNLLAPLRRSLSAHWFQPLLNPGRTRLISS